MVFLNCFFSQSLKSCLMKYNLIAFLVIVLIIESCTSIDPCPPNTTEGNIGSVLNSELDDYSPTFFENSIYYTALLKETNEPEQILRSDMKNGVWTPSVKDNSLPMGSYQKSGLPKFFNNIEKNRVEMYFAGMSKTSKRKSSEILYSYRVDNKWNEPLPIVNLNTEKYESFPAISKDGKILIFASDRPKGYGDLDLYISRRNEDGSWGNPENMGEEINTVEAEKSPYLDEKGNLYFASKGYPGTGKYDIIKAVPNNNGWTNAKALSIPINTEANESGPAIYKNKIYFDSDRRGGCGGKDIFAFDLCGPVFLDGIVKSEIQSIPLNGKIRLSDDNNKELLKLDVLDDGKFSLTLEGGKSYRLQYFNSCFPDYVPEQIINAECNDSVAVKYFASFVITGKTKEFDFSAYNIPFFVSGYYMPNTRNNLESLRMKFSYNLLGSDSSTIYIENPGPEYDEYFEKVEIALDDATEFIVKIIKNLNEECKRDAMGKLKIKVTGFADPRPLSNLAKFQDESIIDQQFGMNIPKGSPMTNELLSLLRAYFTTKYLNEHFSDFDDSNLLENRIIWEIKGDGIDQSDKENRLKRRVYIVISVEGKD